MKDNSLRDRIQGNWKQLSGNVRHEWGKLTHNDVEQVKGDVEVLTGKIQERYGVTKAEARKQIDHWASKFHTHQTEQSDSNAQAD
ncbi:MAG: CsbD family protein [Chloroflexi bacterium]|nr:MAG: CsbD family protein [Chloroflexota bacterium]